MECHFNHGAFRTMYVAMMMFGCILGGCSAQYPSHPSTVRAVLDGPDGPTTVADLRKRYSDVSMDCDGEPAVRCTGILLEATLPRQPWQPYKPDGIPSSWFRVDAPMTATYLPAGMLYYAASDAPRYGKFAQHVRCAYVLNAFTNDRTTRCGPFAEEFNKPESGPCQPQGITTALQWHLHLRRNPQFPNQAGTWQCGFDLTAEDATEVFSHFPTMMREYNENGKGVYHNELIVDSWRPDLPTRVPIEAFFYNTGMMPTSLMHAKELQAIMNDEGGIWRPIVALTLPGSFNDRATFDYFENDQARPMPEATPH